MGEWTYGNQMLIPSDFLSILGLRDNAINWTKKKKVSQAKKKPETFYMCQTICTGE